MKRRTLAATIAALTMSTAAAAAPAVAGAASGWLPVETTGSAGGVRGTVPPIAMNARGDTAVAAPFGLGVSTRPAGGTAFGALTTPGVDAIGNNGNVNVALGDDGTVLLGLGNSTVPQLASGPLSGPLEAPIPISADRATHLYEPHVAVGADGTVVAAWTAFPDDNTTVVRWAIRPPGGAWGPTHSSDPAQYAMFGNLSVDRAGHALIAYTGYDHDSERYDAWTASRDPGGDFGAPERVSTDDDLLPFGAPTVGAIAHDGAAAVLYSTTRTSPERLLLVERTSSSAPWTRRTTLTTGNTNARVIAADDRGDLILSYLSDQPGGYRTIVQTGRLGGSLDAPADLGIGGAPAAAIAEDGTAAVAFPRSGPQLLVTRKAPGGGWSVPERIDDPDSPVEFWTLASPVATLASDADGDLVVGWATNAGIYRVRPFDGAAPHLDVTALPTAPSLGVPAAFSATASDFSPVTVAWDFGDGGSTTGTAAQHAYARPGTFTVKVTATDAVGHATSVTRAVTVATPPAPPAKPAAKPRCKVPSLTNHTLAGAKAMLKSAHCKLGKAVTPKRLKHRKGLVVRSQSRKAGTRTTAGAKVSVTLGTKPKPKRKAHRK
jgi:hypothetical protein